MGTVGSFVALVTQHGSSVLFHRADSLIPCPCRTPEGFRDPEWHEAHTYTFVGTDTPPPEPNEIYNGGDMIAAIDYAEGASATPFTNHQLNAQVFQNDPLGSRAYLELGQLTQSNPLLPDYTNAEQIAWLTATFPTIDPSWWVKVYVATDSGFNHTYWLIDPFYAVQQVSVGLVIPPTPIQPHAVPLVEPPMCNEEGMLPDPGNTVEITVKAFVQPIQSTRATRLSAEYAAQMFGEVQSDDHLGIFAESWGGVELNFNNWSQAGEDYIEYAGRRFLVVNANLIPDPADGNPRHHWEVALRLIGTR